MLGNFSCFCCHLLRLLSKLTFLKKSSFRNTIRVTNSLDQDQDWRSVDPDLGQNCLQRSSAEVKSRWQLASWDGGLNFGLSFQIVCMRGEGPGKTECLCRLGSAFAPHIFKISWAGLFGAICTSCSHNCQCFALILSPSVNSYGHVGAVSSPNHTFSSASLTKQLTSTSCTYFTCNWQQPCLNQQKEENGRINYFMINLHESMGPGRDQTRDPMWCSIWLDKIKIWSANHNKSCCLLKYFRSLLVKPCEPRSDCSILTRVHTVYRHIHISQYC